jgi:hypothetical protein
VITSNFDSDPFPWPNSYQLSEVVLRGEASVVIDGGNPLANAQPRILRGAVWPDLADYTRLIPEFNSNHSLRMKRYGCWQQ